MGCDFSHQPICQDCIDLAIYREKCTKHGGYMVKWQCAPAEKCNSCSKSYYCERSRRFCNSVCAKTFTESWRCWKCFTPRLKGFIQSKVWCVKCRRDTKTATRDELITAGGLYRCHGCYQFYTERNYENACCYPCDVKVKYQAAMRKLCRECPARSETEYENGICANCENDIKVNGYREDCRICHKRKSAKFMRTAISGGTTYYYCSDECRQKSELKCPICSEIYITFNSSKVCSDPICKKIIDASEPKKAITGISGALESSKSVGAIKMYTKKCVRCELPFKVFEDQLHKKYCPRSECYSTGAKSGSVRGNIGGNRQTPRMSAKKSMKKYSMKALLWLNMCAKNSGHFIQHAQNGGEVRYTLPSGKYYLFDGFCRETNTVYEFHGDYWHGNPAKFNSTDINPDTLETFGDLYAKTVERENTIRAAGFNLVVKWESEFDAEL